MIFTAAVATGKKFRRTSRGGDFMDLDQFQDEYGLDREEILAEDYETEPDRGVQLTKKQIDDAWNAARAGTVSVKPAGSTDFYKKFIANLGVR